MMSVVDHVVCLWSGSLWMGQKKECIIKSAKDTKIKENRTGRHKKESKTSEKCKEKLMFYWFKNLSFK